MYIIVYAETNPTRVLIIIFLIKTSLKKTKTKKAAKMPMYSKRQYASIQVLTIVKNT